MVPRVLHRPIGPQQHVAIKAAARQEMLNICRKITFIAGVSTEATSWKKSRDECGR
jgi:hypothetical protein